MRKGLIIKGVIFLEIGKLIEVDIRDLWKHEQYGFSEWLSRNENIEILNEILGLTLVDITKEAYVGTYRCDLFAIDEATGTRVIIENQLESSNHDHLGKIITYASGLDAKVIVWIVKEAKEEHRSAIEWLNNNTNSELNFFLIELHAYKIGDSIPAPKFEIIEKPNGFIKYSKGSNDLDNLNKSQAERLEFWNQFNEIVQEKGKPFNIRKATTAHWYDVALGTSDAHVAISLVNKKSKIRIEIYISDNKDLYDELFYNKEKIEEAFGHELIWDRLDDKKASSIMYEINGLNFDDHLNYRELIIETIDTAVKIRDVFKKYIR
jgi:hypothetical protein